MFMLILRKPGLFSMTLLVFMRESHIYCLAFGLISTIALLISSFSTLDKNQ